MDIISAKDLEKEAERVLRDNGYDGVASLKPSRAAQAGYEWQMDGEPYRFRASFQRICDSPVHAMEVLQDLKSGNLVPVLLVGPSSPLPIKVETKQYALRKRVKLVESEVEEENEAPRRPPNTATLEDVQNARDAIIQSINDSMQSLNAANLRFSEVSAAWLSNPSHSRNLEMEESLRLCKANIEKSLHS